MSVSDVKNSIESSLNQSPFTPDSIYGIVILIILGIAIYRGVKKTLSSPIRVIGLIFLLEIGHILAFSTSLGTSWPFMKVIFKYDVLTAVAQLFVGTKVADGLLWVQAWLNAVTLRAWSVLSYYAGIIFKNMRRVM